jgi:hypothetical protein
MDNKTLLDKIGAYYVAQLKADLRAEGHEVTGALQRSIGYVVTENELSIYSSRSGGLALLGLSEGRKPSNVNPNPNGAFVAHVIHWMRKRGMQPLQYKKDKKTGKISYGFFKKRANYKKAAYGIAKSMLMKGYKGSDTIRRSYKKLESRIDNDILEAFNMQIDKELKNITVK